MPTACELKYVMIDWTMPIFFIAQKHGEMTVHADNINGKITSAAFFKLHRSPERTFVETYGRSVSLGMGPHHDDARIIEHFLGLK